MKTENKSKKRFLLIHCCTKYLCKNAFKYLNFLSLNFIEEEENAHKRN